MEHGRRQANSSVFGLGRDLGRRWCRAGFPKATRHDEKPLGCSSCIERRNAPLYEEVMSPQAQIHNFGVLSAHRFFLFKSALS